MKAHFSLSNPWHFPSHGVPLRCSVPFPQGAVRDPASAYVLLNEAGRDLGAQWRTLSRWRDGSVRFALLDYAEKTLPPRSFCKYRLEERAGRKIEAQAVIGISLHENADYVTVDTGPLRWRISRQRFSLAEQLVFAGREWARSIDLIVEDTTGRVFRASQGEYRVTVEESGPYRVVVLIEGDHRDQGVRFLNYTLRLHFTAGGSQVLMSHHVRNREPGREGRDVRRVSLIGSLKMDGKAIRRILHTSRGQNTLSASIDVPEAVDLDITDHQTTLRNGASLREKPEDILYSLSHSKDMYDHRACAPLLDLHLPGVGGVLMKFAMPDVNREAPMRLGSSGDSFEVDFFPAEGYRGKPIHLNEGMGKTRDLLLNLHDDSLPAGDLFNASDNLSYPGVTGVPASWYRAAKFGDAHLMMEPAPNKYPMLELKIRHLMSEGPLYNKTGRTTQHYFEATGWRDYGDDVAMRGRFPETDYRQFCNNEEDYIHAGMLEAWRNGRPYGAQRQVRHLMDIDYIDFSTDPARDGADCPHSVDHTGGEVYPSHQWCQGLLFYYLATGDNEALRISRRIGDNLIWWIHGPRKDSLWYTGRESAWPLLSLATLYDVTGEEKYRDAGMVIINRMIDIFAEHGRLLWETPPGSGIFQESMLPMTFNGIWDMWAVTGDARILDLWKGVTGPMVEALDQPGNFGYVHFRNIHILWPDLTVLARWYDLTGDERYVRLGRNGLRLVMQGCPQPIFQETSMMAMGYRQFIFFLRLADQFNMLRDEDCFIVW